MSDSEQSALSSLPSDLEDSNTVTSSTNGASKGKGKRKRVQAKAVDSPRSKRNTNGSKVSYAEVEESDFEAETASSPKKTKRILPKSSRSAKNVKLEVDTGEAEVADAAAGATPKRPTKKSKAKQETSTEGKSEANDDNSGKSTAKRKRKTKEEKEAETMPLAARTIGSKLLLGAHVSSAGGVHNAIANSVHIGGNAFALFLKSQRKWENPPLQDEHRDLFVSGCKEHNYHHCGPSDGTPPIVPHGSYLVNLAHPDPDRTKQAYNSFLEDLSRCHKLGIRLYNFHPGSAGASESRDHAITHLASQLNKAHADPSSGSVITLLETMAAGKNILGSTFADLAATIDLVADKSRIGVCLDTCHVFAAGYDLRSPSAFRDTLAQFDETVGLKYLRALHLNDSKAPLNSGRDLHANIGTGFLGLRAFHNLVNEPRLWGLPMVLETPIDVRDERTGKEVPDKGIWAAEIKLLESLVGMDVEGEEFRGLERELCEKGRLERERIMKQVEKKEGKAGGKQTKLQFGKTAEKKKKSGKGRKEEASEASEESS